MLYKLGMNSVDIFCCWQLDFAFNDADLIQEGTLFAIIGRKNGKGRESILKEKVKWIFFFYLAHLQPHNAVIYLLYPNPLLFFSKAIAKAANQFVFIVDESKFTQELIGAVPVLIRQVCKFWHIFFITFISPCYRSFWIWI